MAVTAVLAGVGLVLSVLAWWFARLGPDPLADRTASYGLLWPQGWSFFTSTPDTDHVLAFRLQDGRLHSVTRPIGDPAYRYGLDRSGYTTVLRAIQLAEAVPADRWAACPSGSTVLGCLSGSSYPLAGEGLCGPLVLAVQRSGTVLRVVRVEVRCR